MADGLNQAAKQSLNHPRRSTGTILRVSGTIIDVQFPREAAPAIFNELKIVFPPYNGSPELQASIEVEQHLGDGIVRCIALENIFNIRRGLEVIDTGGPIRVPVGRSTLGRIFDVLGRTIDEKPAVTAEQYLPIHREPPPFIEQRY